MLPLRDHLVCKCGLARTEQGGSVVACVQGMLLHVMAVLSGSTALTMVLALLLIIQPRPLWSAQYLIAMLGLLLGTALSCVATGLSCAVDELSRGGWLPLLTVRHTYSGALNLP